MERVTASRKLRYGQLVLDETVLAADSRPEKAQEVLARAALEAGLPLAARFRHKPPRVNAVNQAWLVAR